MNLVLPLYAQEFSETCGIKVVQLPGVTLVDCPCFAAIEQLGEDYGPVYLDLGLLCDTPPVPEILVESAEGDTGFCNSGIHLIVNGNISGESAAKISELVHHIQLLPVDADARFNVWFARCWLLHHFRLLHTN